MHVIDLGTLSALHQRHYELHAYCSHCDRWRALDLAFWIARGLGDKRLPIRVRCLRCGKHGVVQVRPPTPTRPTMGWIPPPTRGVSGAVPPPTR